MTVRQTQAAEPFRIHLEIGIKDADGRIFKRQKVETGRGLERYSIPSGTAPADVVLDPDVWMLFEAGAFKKVG